MNRPPIPPHLTLLFAEFERQSESSVRHAVMAGEYDGSSSRLAAATEWLRLKDELRAAESAARQDIREEEALSIAREALATSKQATDNSTDANTIAREALATSRQATVNSTEANEIARSAEANARFANRVAVMAIVLTIAMAIKELIEWYSK